MTSLRPCMVDDMVSAGLAANTQAAYIRAVHGLAKRYRGSPDELSEAQVRSYLLHLRNERGVARGTFQPYHAGVKTPRRSTLLSPLAQASHVCTGPKDNVAAPQACLQGEHQQAPIATAVPRGEVRRGDYSVDLGARGRARRSSRC